MSQGAVTKSINEGLLDLDDQWSNNLTIVDQLDEVPTGPHDPSVVLCTLEGILSDYSESTRNDRWYSGELWDIVLNSESFKELERTRTLFGESDHPMDVEDRFDVHYNYVSHCVRDVVHDHINHCVRGKIDVLDTPAGRIIFTFVKYGSILGVSSRGAGDLIERNGRVEVDPFTYQFYAWDIVHRPSNRKARVVQLSESIKPSTRLTTLIESAKSDRNSLGWIRSLVESTEVPDKEDLLNKVNEYIGMFDEENPVDNFQESERENYELKIKDLQSDIIELSNKVVELQNKLSVAENKNSQSSNLSVDTTKLEELLNKFNIAQQTKLDESIENVKSENSEILSAIDSISEMVLDRIDEAYNNLIKPIVASRKLVQPISEQIKANGDFIVGSVSKLIPASDIIQDNSVKIAEIESKLNEAESTISELSKENKNLNNKIKTMLESRISETRKYLSTRCSQLGLNESSVIRKLGEITDYTFDELDDELREIYQNSPKKKLRQGIVNKNPNSIIGHGEIVIDDNGMSDSTSSLNESHSLNNDALVSLIRDNT